jgi:1-deoxy-D-xylulose-5-phosphate synthase
MRRPPLEHPLLSRITSPAELRRVPRDRLPALAEELRRCLADHVSMPPAVLGPSLEVVELAIALHYVYKTPQDRLVWDGGQTTYAHKMLTGRRPRLHAARQKAHLVGTRARGESRYDELGAAHAGSAISVALGISSAAAARGERGRVVAVIGARELAAGMAFEALNHAGSLPRDLLVILNDSDASFVRGAGALSAQFARAFSGTLYGQLRAGGKRILSQMPTMRELARRSEKHLKGMVLPGSLFEEMGFHYTGPFDGSDVIGLVRTLQNLQKQAGPQFLHVVTPAAKAPRRPAQAALAASGFARTFGDWACETAQRDERLVCISTSPAAAVGLAAFAQQFPGRYFEATGSEQHAVTLAAGLATEGQRPVLALRASQLARVYDQLIHDVALQNLPVLFAAGEAGFSGAERTEEHSPCDLSFLRCIPGLTIAVPADEDECRRLLNMATTLKGPAVVRFPGGEARAEAQPRPLSAGRGVVVREGGSGTALLVFGTLLDAARHAAERLDATLVNMRFVKPLDETLLVAMASQHLALVTIEENVVAGGAGSAVAEWLHARRHALPVLHLGIAPGSLSRGSRAACLEAAGLDASGLITSIERWLASRGCARRQAAGA